MSTVPAFLNAGTGRDFLSSSASCVSAGRGRGGGFATTRATPPTVLPARPATPLATPPVKLAARLKGLFGLSRVGLKLLCDRSSVGEKATTGGGSLGPKATCASPAGLMLIDILSLSTLERTRLYTLLTFDMIAYKQTSGAATSDRSSCMRRCRVHTPCRVRRGGRSPCLHPPRAAAWQR